MESNYFIIFPSFLLNKLSSKRCVLIGLLMSLAKKDGYAYIGNSTLSDILQCTNGSIQSDLQYIEKEGYITREVVRNDANEVIMRKIYIVNSLSEPLIQNNIPPHPNNCMTLPQNFVPPSPKILSSYIYKDIQVINKDKSIVSMCDFDSIWNEYGKKGVKSISLKAFNRLSDNDKQSMYTYIPLYINNHIKNDKIKFLPHLSTFINQKRWLDELPYESENKNNLEIDW